MYLGVAESPGGPVRGSLDRLGREPGLSHFWGPWPGPGELNRDAGGCELVDPSFRKKAGKYQTQLIRRQITVLPRFRQEWPAFLHLELEFEFHSLQNT